MADFSLLLFILKMADEYCKRGGKKDLSCINWNTAKIHKEIIEEYRDDLKHYFDKCEEAEHFNPEKVNDDLDVSYLFDILKSLVRNESIL